MPAPGFVTDAELQTALEAVLKVPPGSLAIVDSAYWLTIIHDSNAAAYHDTIAVLLQRGLSLAQADTWFRGREFQLDIGLYWCLVKGGALHNYDDKFVTALDRRAELAEMGLYDETGAALVPPLPPGEGQVAHGPLNTEMDIFALGAPPPLPRRGYPTRW
jgi:hypothetical protein